MMITIPVFTLLVTAFYLCLPLDEIKSTTTLAVVSNLPSHQEKQANNVNSYSE